MQDDRNESFFDEIYEKVFPIVYRIVYKITGRSDVSEDLCQEAFIKYHQRMNSIPDPEQAKFWLIRVSKNLALNYQKRKGRERKAYLKVLKEPSRPMDTGEDEALKKEASAAVKVALEKLPEKLRVVMILKEYSNLNYKEIASTLGISEGNVKVRVYRAREYLSKLLDEGETYVP
ncbi:MAG: RNA polymerase sigma factor [Spirochaetia bacterium]